MKAAHSRRKIWVLAFLVTLTLAGVAGWYTDTPASVRAGRARRDSGAAGSLVLRRMDRRGHKRGLVRAKKHSTKSGSGRTPDLSPGPYGTAL